MHTPLSISSQLVKFLQQNRGWFASGDLQRMKWFNKSGSLATPRSIVRRLEECAAEGKIFVEMRNGHAFYSAEYKPLTKQTIEYLQNGEVRVSYVPVDKTIAE